MDAEIPAALTARSRALAERPGRAIVGIVGAPGSGKSTLAAALVELLREDGRSVALVSMDGFHLPQPILVERGPRNVMGRIDTFDAGGYLDVLRRLRGERVVLAPDFDRSVEESVADAIRVGPDAQLVVTEGNYLLDSEPPWVYVRALLDHVWFVDVDEEVRRNRLLRRHVAFGKSPAEASEWIDRVDDPAPPASSVTVSEPENRHMGSRERRGRRRGGHGGSVQSR